MAQLQTLFHRSDSLPDDLAEAKIGLGGREVKDEAVHEVGE